MVGSDLLLKFIFVLQFRQPKYTHYACIERMFLQVEVLDHDQNLLYFLWPENIQIDVIVHPCTRHIFGARISPRCANFALR